MVLLMMKYELHVVLLIPMGMVVLPCNIIALLIQYLTVNFSFIKKSMNIFNVIIHTEYFFIASDDLQHAFRSKITWFSNILYELVNPAVDGYIFRCIVKTVKSDYWLHRVLFVSMSI
jgi:hypothetical protein